MQVKEPEIHAVEEARRHSAAKVRALLEELEAAEREFEALTKKMKALSEPIPPRKEPAEVSSTR